jgi:predicted nucleic acid-binding protein
VITVVSDTSPLVAFSFLAMEALISQMLGEVLIPPAVAAEVATPRFGFAGITTNLIPGVHVRTPTDRTVIQDLMRRVDIGEAESLALALELRADLLIVDDAAARAVAREFGLNITGTIGLLLRAKQEGHLGSIRTVLDRLRTELRFFVSEDLYRQALIQAGE